MKKLILVFLAVAVLAVLASVAPRDLAKADPPATDAYISVVAPADPQDGTFSVDIDLTTANTGFAGCEWKLQYDPTVVAFDSADCSPSGDPDWYWYCIAAAIDGDKVHSGNLALATDGTPPPPPLPGFTGTLQTYNMHCVAPGTSPLHLFDSLCSDDQVQEIPSFLSDGEVTCALAAVGGIVEMQVGESGSPASLADGSSSSSPPYALIAGAAAASALAVVAGGWYARRRWVR